MLEGNERLVLSARQFFIIENHLNLVKTVEGTLTTNNQGIEALLRSLKSKRLTQEVLSKATAHLLQCQTR